MSNVLPSPTPAMNPETQPFWDAAAEGRLLLKRCEDCACVIWYPRAICPRCWSSRTVWFESPGAGTIYSCTVVRKGEGVYAAHTPYVLAYVELDEGPRVLTQVLAVDPFHVEIGVRVQVSFCLTDDGVTALPRFQVETPADPGAIDPRTRPAVNGEMNL